MTSQVAVMNLRGIAVASDTVLTLSGSSGSKTMGNSGKIYEIGPDHNLLILHSGNADLNYVPAYIYVSEWSRTLAGPLATLQDYVDSFIKWVSRDSSIHSQSTETGVTSAALDEHFSWVRKNCDRSLANIPPKASGEKENTYQKRLNQVVESEIKTGFDFLNDLEKFPNLTENSAAQILEDSDYDLDAWIDYHFENVPLSENAKTLLRRSAALCIARYQELPGDCLLAFVGYGSDEPFGGSIRVSCRGIYGGQLRCKTDLRFTVSPDDSKSGISHFAQGDAIAMFLRGYQWRIMDRFRSLISGKTASLSNEAGELVDGQELASEIISEIESFSHERFVSPLLDAVEAMGLQTLGDFAGSLVGLQATSTYSQNGPATVGGLIEIVTIDRAHGVQWLRKLGSEKPTPFID